MSGIREPTKQGNRQSSKGTDKAANIKLFLLDMT